MSYTDSFGYTPQDGTQPDAFGYTPAPDPGYGGGGEYSGPNPGDDYTPNDNSGDPSQGAFADQGGTDTSPSSDPTESVGTKKNAADMWGSDTSSDPTESIGTPVDTSPPAFADAGGTGPSADPTESIGQPAQQNSAPDPTESVGAPANTIQDSYNPDFQIQDSYNPPDQKQGGGSIWDRIKSTASDVGAQIKDSIDPDQVGWFGSGLSDVDSSSQNDIFSGANLKADAASAAAGINTVAGYTGEVKDRLLAEAALAANNTIRNADPNAIPDFLGNIPYDVTGQQLPWQSNNDYQTAQFLASNQGGLSAMLPGTAGGGDAGIYDVPVVGFGARVGKAFENVVSGDGDPTIDTNQLQSDIASGQYTDKQLLEKYPGNEAYRVIQEFLNPANFANPEVAGVGKAGDILGAILKAPTARAIDTLADTTRATGWTPEASQAADTILAQRGTLGNRGIADLAAPDAARALTDVRVQALPGMENVSTATDTIAGLYDGAARLAQYDALGTVGTDALRASAQDEAIQIAQDLSLRNTGGDGATQNYLDAMETIRQGRTADLTAKTNTAGDTVAQLASGTAKTATDVVPAAETKVAQTLADVANNLRSETPALSQRDLVQAADKRGINLNTATSQEMDWVRAEASRQMLASDVRAAMYDKAGAALPGTESALHKGLAGTFNAVRGLLLMASAPPLALQKFSDEWVRALSQGVVSVRPQDLATLQAAARFGADRNVLGQADRFKGFLDNGTVQRLANNDVLPPAGLTPRTAKAAYGIKDAFAPTNRYGEAMKPGDRLAAVLGAPSRAIGKFNDSLIGAPTQHVILNAFYHDTKTLDRTRAAIADKAYQDVLAAGLGPEEAGIVQDRLKTATTQRDFVRIGKEIQESTGIRVDTSPAVPAAGMAKGTPFSPSNRVTNDMNRTGGAFGLVGKAGETSPFVQSIVDNHPVPSFEEIKARMADNKGALPNPYEKNLGSAGAGMGQPVRGSGIDLAAGGDGGAGYLSRQFRANRDDLNAMGGFGSGRTLDYGTAKGAPRTANQSALDTAAATRRGTMLDDLRQNGSLDTTLAGIDPTNLAEIKVNQVAANTEIKYAQSELARGVHVGNEAAVYRDLAEMERFANRLAEMRTAIDPAYTSDRLAQERFGANHVPTAQERLDTLAQMRGGEVRVDNTAGPRQIGSDARLTPTEPDPTAAINEKAWYHGTGATDLNPGALDPTATSTDGLYGPGIYLTDNPSVAGGYSRSAVRRGKTGAASPTVYESRVNAGKVLDLDKPAPQDVRDLWRAHTEQVYGGDDEEWIALLHNPQATTRQMFDMARTETRAGYWDIDLGDLFAEFNQDMAIKNGYDGYTHVGGNRVGKVEHRVFIGLDPNDVYGTGRSGIIPEFAPRAETPVPTEPDPTELIGAPKVDATEQIGQRATFQPVTRNAFTPTESVPAPLAPHERGTIPLGAPRDAQALATAGETANQALIGRGAELARAQREAVAAGTQRGYRIVGNQGDQTTLGSWMKNGIGGVTPPVLPFAPFHIHSAQFWARAFANHPALAVGVAQALGNLDDYGTLHLPGGQTIGDLTKLLTGAHLVDWAMKAYRYDQAVGAQGRNNPLQRIGKDVAYNTVGNNAFIRPFEYVGDPLTSFVQSHTNPLLTGKTDFNSGQPAVDPRDQYKTSGTMAGLSGIGQSLNDRAGQPLPRNLVSTVTNPGQAIGNLTRTAVSNLSGSDLKQYNFENQIPYKAQEIMAATGFDTKRFQAGEADAMTGSPQTPDGMAILDAFQRVQDRTAIGRIAPIQVGTDEKGIFPPTSHTPTETAAYYRSLDYQQRAGEGGKDFGTGIPAGSFIDTTGKNAGQPNQYFIESPDQARYSTARADIVKANPVTPESVPFMDYNRQFLGNPDIAAMGSANQQSSLAGVIQGNATRTGAGLPQDQRMAQIAKEQVLQQQVGTNPDGSPFTLGDLLRQPGNVDSIEAQLKGMAAGPQKTALEAALADAKAKDASQSSVAGTYFAQQDAAYKAGLVDKVTGNPKTDGLNKSIDGGFTVGDFLNQPGNVFDLEKQIKGLPSGQQKTALEKQLDAVLMSDLKLHPEVSGYFGAAGQLDVAQNGYHPGGGNGSSQSTSRSSGNAFRTSPARSTGSRTSSVNRPGSTAAHRGFGSGNSAGSAGAGTATAGNDFFNAYRAITDSREKAAVLAALDRAGLNIGTLNKAGGATPQKYQAALDVVKKTLAGGTTGSTTGSTKTTSSGFAGPIAPSSRTYAEQGLSYSRPTLSLMDAARAWEARTGGTLTAADLAGISRLTASDANGGSGTSRSASGSTLPGSSSSYTPKTTKLPRTSALPGASPRTVRKAA